MAFITVEATVERVFFEGRGLALVEEYKTKDGDSRVNRYTAWFDVAPGLTENQTAKFSGILTTKIEEFEGKDGQTRRKVVVAINKAKAEVGSGHTLSKPVETKATGWASPAEDLGAPF